MAASFQLLPRLVHSISLFITPQPANETEKQLVDLMTHYKMDMGAGIHRSMGNLFTDLSAHFTLACLLGGLINGFLLSK